mgnify:CR=1 FL=1
MWTFSCWLFLVPMFLADGSVHRTADAIPAYATEADCKAGWDTRWKNIAFLIRNKATTNIQGAMADPCRQVP